jgi:hypothetical protein
MSYLFRQIVERKKSPEVQLCPPPHFTSYVEFWTWVRDKTHAALESDDVEFKDRVIAEVRAAIELYDKN